MICGCPTNGACSHEWSRPHESSRMKKSPLFNLIILLLLAVPVQDVPARGYTRLLLPEGARDRFGEGLLSGDIAYSTNGAWLAVPSSIGIWLYNPRTGVLRDHLDTGFVRSVAFSPDGRTLASGGGGEVRLWQIGSGRLLGTLKGHEGFVRSVAFSPDGRTLAAASGSEILLWEVGSGQPEATLEGHAGQVESLAFSPDGRTLASGGGDYTIRLWEVGSGQLRISLEGHSGRVESVAFSPDGRTLASAGWDGTARLWDAETGKPGIILKRQMEDGLRDWVWSAAFSPDGEILASGHDDAIRLWDVDSGRMKAALTLNGHTSWVSAVAFSPDGRTLASGSRSRSGGESRYYTALLWDISPRTEVLATVLGAERERVTVEFSRAISGRRPHYAWSATTGEAGRLDLTFFPGVNGYYRARARTADGLVAGKWNSIPLNSGRRQFLELVLGGGMRVVAVEKPAAKAAAQGAGVDELYPNIPNPFNSGTLIAYALASPGRVRLEVYNVLGQPVDTLVDEVQAAGAYQASWNGRDRWGAAVAAGVYLVRLSCPGGVRTRRLVYLK